MGKLATFGAGCFWGIEMAFREVDGVTDTAVGYMGGSVENPSYEDVCTGRTGHAEVVQVSYDPDSVSYHDLLRVFWDNHDPTTRDRQGPDVGSQYRSAIFFHDDDQRTVAEQQIQTLNQSKRWPDSIVTQVTPADTFYRAEEYHQQYLAKRGGRFRCI